MTTVAQIAAGAEFCLVLGSDGSVWAWGADYDGQLGNTATYTALRADGTVLAWGDNEHGEIGNGTTSDSPTLPTEVTGLTSVTQVSAGGEFSLAVHTVYDF